MNLELSVWMGKMFAAFSGQVSTHLPRITLESYVNGKYITTSVEMQFAGRYGRGVKYSTIVKEGSDTYSDLEVMRSTASKIVAKRMIEELCSSGRVAWASILTITDRGIEKVTSRLGPPDHSFALESGIRPVS